MLRQSDNGQNSQIIQIVRIDQRDQRGQVEPGRRGVGGRKAKAVDEVGNLMPVV